MWHAVVPCDPVEVYSQPILNLLLISKRQNGSLWGPVCGEWKNILQVINLDRDRYRFLDYFFYTLMPQQVPCMVLRYCLIFLRCLSVMSFDIDPVALAGNDERTVFHPPILWLPLAHVNLEKTNKVK